MLSRVRHLSRRADVAAKKQGHSWPGRICIGLSVGVGSYLGARYGEKHGEKVTKAFIDRSLSFVPLPLKGSVSTILAKRFGPQVGVHCGMLLGAALGGVLAKQTLTWGEKLLLKKKSASGPSVQIATRALSAAALSGFSLAKRSFPRLSIPPLRKSFSLRLPTREVVPPLKFAQE